LAAHAVAAEPIGDVEALALGASVSQSDQVARVVEQIPASTAGVSLTDADVVVSGGRGVARPRGSR